MCGLQSLLVLSFAAGRCFLLLNTDWLLQLQWRPAEAELQPTSCCHIQLGDGGGQTAVDRCICRETLFVLGATGLVCILNCSDKLISVPLQRPDVTVVPEDKLTSKLG